MLIMGRYYNYTPFTVDETILKREDNLLQNHIASEWKLLEPVILIHCLKVSQFTWLEDLIGGAW